MSASGLPRINRREMLGLLGGSAAFGINRWSPAQGSTAPYIAGDGITALEFDARMASRVVRLESGRSQPLTQFEISESMTIEGRGNVSAYVLAEARAERLRDPLHGLGTRHVLRGVADAGLEKTARVVFWENYPGMAFLDVSFHNLSGTAMQVEGWSCGAHRLQPGSAGADFWCYSGASFEDRRDWVQRARPGFAQRNYLGMNASDYGGGTPVVDVWRRDVGLAAGHVEPRPRLVSLPVEVTADGARIAVESDSTLRLAAGESLVTPQLFVATHRGDHYATLVRYRKVMAAQGLQAPVPNAACYEPIWCAWGYERDFKLEQVVATLPKARELGLVWAVVDDGWQTAEGDWYLDPRKFPRGDADMIALTSAIRSAGMKPKLWLAPLAVDPGTDLLHDATDLLLLNEDGSVRDVTWWNSFYLCPAYPATIERSVALVRKILGEWGFEGLKLDGQHLNAVPPCYNPAHKHARPEESLEKLQDFWKAIYAAAMSINPQAVVELCPCGTSYAFHNLPGANQTVGSDPESSWQVRLKGKTLKALMGPAAAYAGDHVELSDNGDDFASTVGIGGVVSTKFTLATDPGPDPKIALTPERESRWRRWIALYNENRLAEHSYRGELYDLGFDRPEAHVVEKNGRLYYAFYAERWDGPIELRGLGRARYRVADYFNDKPLGEVTAATNRLHVAFERFLLLEAAPVNGARS